MNEEGPPGAQLIADEAAAYRQTHAAGLTMTFGRTGIKLAENCALGDFVANADRLVFQTQDKEFIDPAYAADVHVRHFLENAP